MNMDRLFLLFSIVGVLLVSGCTTTIPQSFEANICGNNVCELSNQETYNSCSQDCSSLESDICGNGICESSNQETCTTCPIDCPTCDLTPITPNSNAIHLVSITISAPPTMTIWMEYEKQHDWYYPNTVTVMIQNNGNVVESLSVNCNSIISYINVQPQSSATTSFDMVPSGSISNINCRASNSYVDVSSSVPVNVVESEWYKWDKIPKPGYLSCTAGANCNDYSIQTYAESLRKKNLVYTLTNDRETIFNDIPYNYSLMYENPANFIYPASKTLATKSGVCVHKAILFAAVARYQGIPTRVETGCAQSDFCDAWNTYCITVRALFGQAIQHAWNQVWVHDLDTDPNSAGEWVFLDPTWNAVVSYPFTPYRRGFCDDNLMNAGTFSNCWWSTYVEGIWADAWSMACRI